MSKNKTSKKLTNKQIERIFSLSQKGLSQREIAKKIGRSRSAVWYHLTK